MTTIEFFNNNELSDISKIRIYDDINGQNAFFNGLDKKTVQGQYKGFTEPLLIFEAIEDAVKYSYGRFQIGSNWYYFFVADVQQDTASKSWIYYRLDYWETTRYQFSTSLGRGTITRSSLVEPCATPYNAKYMKIKYRKFCGLGNDQTIYTGCDIVFTARVSSENENFFGYIMGPFNDREKYLILNGLWATYFKWDGETPFAPADIQGAWFTPRIINDFTPYIGYGWEIAASISSDLFVNKCILSNGEIIGGHFFRPIEGLLLSADKLNDHKTTNTSTSVIKDLEGNVVYQLETNREYSDDIQARLVLSPTSAKWLCRGGVSLKPDVQFTLPCSALDYYIDTEKEYYARDRQFDIETRELNSKKNLTSGIVGGGASALSGAATGALVGSVVPGIGTAVGAIGGAIAGAVGGAITSGAQRGLDNYYNPQEQAIKDAYYHNALDSLSIVGSNLTQFAFSGSSQCALFQYECDPDTKARIESDIAEFGQYTSKAVPSGESYIASDARLKGDFIVLGSIPESWKGGIQQRISSGVHVIKH